MSTRREFLQKAFWGTAGLTLLSALPGRLFSSENIPGNFTGNDLVKLTILHTNDMHSRIEPFPENDPKNPGLGGMARRASLIKKIRESEKNVLLFDAGDVFQGTPYFNIYGGELEFKLMTMMGYDAATLGNHDFDNGLDGLLKMLPYAGFPFVCSNYDFSDTVLKGKVLRYKIFKKDGIKVGVYGIGIELKGLVENKSFGNTVYRDPVTILKEMETFLKKEKKCHLVVCLSHLGYKYDSGKVDDVTLAGESEHTDLIIGGHTHTFLDEPAIVKNRMNSDVLINQAGWAGIRLGKIDCFFERKSSKKVFTKTNFSDVK